MSRKLRIVRYPTMDGEIALLDMRVPGRRVFDRSGSTGVASSDHLTGLGEKPIVQVRFINEAVVPPTAASGRSRSGSAE